MKKSKLNTPLWKPGPKKIKSANLTDFRKFVNRENGIKIKNYSELYKWSVSEIESFWETLWKYLKIIHSSAYSSVLSERKMPGAKWFLGTKLNFAENLLRYRDDKIALISHKEGEERTILTYKELYDKVAACAGALRALNVQAGDRVAGFMTNIPETVIAMLAATSIGAIWSSCSPDFGINGVLDRFSQIKPKILFAIGGYQYNGKEINCEEKINEIAKDIPEIENVVVIPRNDSDSVDNYSKGNSANFLFYNELLDINSIELSFDQFPFDHPVYIMYSSGTTGLPKCMVHGAGGILLQHFKEHFLHTNLTRNDVITYYTTCGWMMWNWLVSALQVGATIFLFDGSPVYPDMEILWRQIEKVKISVFGTSPKFLSMSQKAGLIPGENLNLESLKTILSTGSPLSVENFEWVYSNVKKDIQLSSISGGTDIVSCFMLGNPVLPVYKGEIQCRGLGMRVEAYDEKGNPVVNEKGELVCTEPFPVMPVYFWNDKDGTRYHNAYFNKFEGVWTHGDYIEIKDNGGIVVYGRSDSTLNPGGVRIGTSEIYRIVEKMDEISDSIVAGKKINNDEEIILFIVLQERLEISDDLIDRIKKEIKSYASPRHVPSFIYPVNEIPRTISGKKVEIAVANIINNRHVDNRDALINPDSLKQFELYR